MMNSSDVSPNTRDTAGAPHSNILSLNYNMHRPVNQSVFAYLDMRGSQSRIFCVDGVV